VRSALILFCFPLFCNSLSAQWLGGGIKGGFGHNAADAWSRGTATELIQPTIGPFLELRLPFGLAFEANALRRSATYIYEHGSPALAFREGRAEGHAWEFPVMAKARIGPWKWKPFVLAGPTFLTFGTLSGTQTCTGPACGVGLGPVSIEFRGGIDRGFTLGGGVERRFGPVRLSAEARHSRFEKDVGTGRVDVRPGQTLVLFGLGF
jgi:hypothetical protein